MTITCLNALQVTDNDRILEVGSDNGGLVGVYSVAGLEPALCGGEGPGADARTSPRKQQHVY